MENKIRASFERVKVDMGEIKFQIKEILERLDSLEKKFKNEKIIAIIPARGGSKRIPKKNIKLLNEKPLIAYSIEQALASKYIGEIFVSTDDDEIAEISKEYGAQVIKRPLEISKDKSKTGLAVEHVLENVSSSPEFVVLLQPTSPLRKVETIDSAIEYFLKKSIDYDSLISIKEIKFKKGKISGKEYVQDYKDGTMTQDLKSSYYETGAVYVYKIFNKTKIKNGKILPFIMQNGAEAIDIDSLEDFKIVESIMKERDKN